MQAIGIEADDKQSILYTSSPYRDYHKVQVAIVCDALEEEFQRNESPFEVGDIYNEKEVFVKGVKHMPDAVIVFQRKDGISTSVIPVFLEIERNYTSVDRLVSKLRRYDLAFSDNAYEKILGDKILSPRILFVSQKDGQFTALQKKMDACKHSKDLNILLINYQEIITASGEAVYLDMNIKKKKLSYWQIWSINNESSTL